MVAHVTSTSPDPSVRDSVRRQSQYAVTHRLSLRLHSAWDDLHSWMTRRVDLELSRRPPEFRVDAFVLGLFARQRGHSFVELGANNGINSHTRHFEAQLGWRGTCLEASPPNFAQLVANRPIYTRVHA